MNPGSWPSSHGCLCSHILPAPWVKGSRVQWRPQGDSRDHHPLDRVRKCFHSSPSPLPEALLSSVHVPLLFLPKPNSLYDQSRQVLMARPWKIKCRWTELQWKMWSFSVFPTVLALNCWDVIPSGISSPSLAPNARDLFFHVHLSCTCPLSPRMLLVAVLPGSACGLEQCLHYWRSMSWQAPRARPVQPEGEHTLGKQVVLPAAKTSAALAQSVYRGKGLRKIQVEL